MSLPFSADQLKQHVNQDMATCASLLELLTQEQTALKRRDADAVESILEKKVSLLEILEGSAKLRQAWAVSAQQTSDEQGWSQIISELGNSEIKQQWAALKDMYIAVRQQNEINGKLLARHQKTVSRLLDVMRGKTAGPSLYNASGYSSNQARSNKFGEA